MKTEEEQYEQWLQKVRSTSPILKNPEELTHAIMIKVDQTSRKRVVRQRLLSWGLSIAAGFLICFGVYETYFYPGSREMEYKMATAKTVTFLTDKKSTSTLHSLLPEMSIIEKSHYLSDILKKHRENQIWRMNIRNNFRNKSDNNLLK